MILRMCSYNMAVTHLLMIVLLSCYIVLAADASPPGWISPSGEINELVGGNFRIVCTMNENNNQSIGKNSSSLYFELGNKRVTDNITVLNRTSIELNIKNATYMTNKVSCKSGTDGIDFVKVFVGYKPKDVIDFKCVSNNWENLNCSFERQNNSLVPVYNLTFKYSNYSQRIYSCDLNGNLNNKYWCEVNGIDYHQTQGLFIFNLNAHNSKGEHQQNFEIQHFSTVVPDAPVLNLVKNTTPTSVEIQYSIPSKLGRFPEDLLAKFEIFSDLNNKKILYYQILSNLNGSLEQTYTLNNLVPHTWFRVQLRLRSVLANDTDEMWSKYSEKTFLTSSLIPKFTPETDMGAFSIMKHESFAFIYIYWKEVPKDLHFGNNFSVVIHLHKPAGIPFQQINGGTAYNGTMAKFNTSKDINEEDLEFRIYSRNIEGTSKNFSTLLIPRQSKRLKPPTNLKKILEKDRYKISWSPASDQRVKDYTVFWCHSKNEGSDQCDKSINFTHVNSTNFTHDSTDVLSFAVSANSYESSSGLIWTKCTARSNYDIGRPINIIITKSGSTFISLNWNLECADQSIVAGYILKYCIVKDPKTNTCEQDETPITFETNSLKYDLQNLRPYTIYKITLSMYSAKKSVGPPSEPLVNTTYESKPSPPQNFRASNITNTSALLSWDPPEEMNGVLRKYVVEYGHGERSVDKNLTTYLMSDLKSFKTYSINVRACTGDCSNNSTTRIETLIGRPSQISQIHLNRSETYNFIWDPPADKSGPISYYELKVVYIHFNKEAKENVFKLSKAKCSNVKDQCYETLKRTEVQVRAVNVRGSSNYAISKTGNRSFICEEGDLVDLNISNQEIFAGNWSVVTPIECSRGLHEVSSHQYISKILLIVTVVTAASFIFGVCCYRYFKTFKDIGIELPAGLEDINEDKKCKSADINRLSKIDNLSHNDLYTDAPSERLLRPCVEHGNFVQIEEKILSPHIITDDIVQAISKTIPFEETLSKKDMISLPLNSNDAKNSRFIVDSSTNSFGFASGEYVPASILCPDMPKSQQQQSNEYTTWNSVIQSAPYFEKSKIKTNIVASTDFKGISGYVTHKQLSNFGQLLQ